MSTLGSGFSTGTCAAAAAKAAALLLRGEASVTEVEIGLPDGEQIRCPRGLEESTTGPENAQAAVRKDAGDDPDITHRAVVKARVAWKEGEGIEFQAGEGVGTVTMPGLAIPPGEAAIESGPPADDPGFRS